MDYQKMALELIDDFLSVLVHYDLIDTFNKVCDKYSDIIKESHNNLMKGIDETNIPSLKEEQSERIRTELYEKIKQHEEYQKDMRFLKAIFED